MADKKYMRQFSKYVTLNIFGMLGLSCYILADTFFVSRGLGANGLTALNLAIPVYSFVHGTGLLLGMGGATKYAISKSQNDGKIANHIFTETLLLALVFSAVYFLAGLFLSESIVTLLGADSAVFEMSKTYLKVILLFAPMFILNNVLLCFVRNDGAPQLSMMAMLGGSLSNIILDYIFIFPFKMGIFGAVFATGLAPVISMLILSPFFIKRKNCFHLIKCRITSQLAGNIISGGLPSLVTEVSSGIVIIVFNTIILGLEGNTGVAAYGVIANLSLVVISIFNGIAQGIQPILSTCCGSGDTKGSRIILRYALTLMLIMSGIIYFSVFFGAPAITLLFNSEQNMVLQSISEAGLRIYFTACLFAGFNIILSVFFTSMDHARPAHIISILRGFIIIIPMAFILSDTFGMTGVFSVFPLTELIVSLIGLIFLLKQLRHH